MHGGTFFRESATSEEWTIDGYAHVCVRTYKPTMYCTCVRADGMRKSVYRSYYCSRINIIIVVLLAVRGEGACLPFQIDVMFRWSVNSVS
jgi:hypothetical protein